MLNEYQTKRMEYHLYLNDLNKYKKDYELKKIDVSSKKFNSECKKRKENIEKLKLDLDNYFEANKDIIVKEMLNKYLNVEEDFDFYDNDKFVVEEDKKYILKKSREEIIADIDLYREKASKKLDDKIFTSVIYDDLMRCLVCYQDNILSKWKVADKKILVSNKEKLNKNVKKKHDENFFFVRVMMPMIILDIICIFYMLIKGGECELGSNYALSGILCSFMVVSRIFIVFATPIILIYLLVVLIHVCKKKRK